MRKKRQCVVCASTFFFFRPFTLWRRRRTVNDIPKFKISFNSEWQQCDGKRNGSPQSIKIACCEQKWLPLGAFKHVNSIDVKYTDRLVKHVKWHLCEQIIFEREFVEKKNASECGGDCWCVISSHDRSIHSIYLAIIEELPVFLFCVSFNLFCKMHFIISTFCVLREKTAIKLKLHFIHASMRHFMCGGFFMLTTTLTFLQCIRF